MAKLQAASGSEGRTFKMDGMPVVMLDGDHVSVDFMPGDTGRQPRIEVTDLDGRVYVVQLSKGMLHAICAWTNSQA